MLTDRNLPALLQGVSYCQKQQQALFRVGAGILAGGKIRIAEKFRFVFMNELAESDVLIFTQPIMLQRLAQYIVHVKVQAGDWVGKKGLPLIVCVLNPRRNIYLVTGVNCAEQGEEETKWVVV